MNFEFTEEQKMLRQMTRQFVMREILPTLKDYERQEKPNHAIIKKMAPLGLLGFNIPQEYGGAGLDCITWAIVWEELSWGSWSVAQSSNSSILPGTIILAAGSEEQKQKWLPAMCNGEQIFAMAVVEPNVGSDASAIETTATLDGNSWVLNGNKTFISNGGVADVVLVLAQGDKSQGVRGMVVIAVDKGTPGFVSTNIPGKVGYRSANLAQLRFTDCRVPRENLVGEIGSGFKNAIIGIDTARYSIAAGCIGIAQSCLDACIQYAKERRQFNRPIASFQMVQAEIAEMAAQIEVLRWYIYYLGDLKNRGVRHVKETSVAKYLASETAVRVSAKAIQLYGAYGCVDDCSVEHHYRDAILTTILGGTTNIHKLTIGRELLGIDAIT